MNKCFYYKSKYCEYEKEYRLTLRHEELQGNFAYLNNEDIGEVYFGLKTPEELKEKNPSNFKNIKFYKMSIKEGYYELESQRI